MNNFAYKESTFSLMFYGLFILLTAYFGSLMLNKSSNNDFYINVMLEWKQAMLNYQYSGIPLPNLDKKDPYTYMKNLSKIIASRDLAEANPNFTYEIKLADGSISQVFLLAQADVLHIYGLDKQMVDDLDKMIDRKNNLAAGHWVAFQAKNKPTYHAVWFYKKG